MQPPWKTVRRILRKLKVELPYDLASVLLGIYPHNTKILIQRDTHTLVFITALLTIAKLWKEPKSPPTDEWIKKMCIYTMNSIQA